MRFAVISDLHSNIVALNAVFADIDQRGIETVYCLGDVVGYGPKPVECLDLVMDRCVACVRGNHDHALFAGSERFNPYAHEAVEWTRAQLRPGLIKNRSRAAQARWKFLENLPEEHRFDDILMVHGSPRDRVNEYIYREDVFFNAEGKLKQIFDAVDRLLFVGHTHLPVVICNDLSTFVPQDDELSCQLEDGKYIINVGSVGQPRDRDVRACYVEYEDNIVNFHRVEYDIDTTAAAIRSEKRLDNVLAQRLYEGM